MSSGWYIQLIAVVCLVLVSPGCKKDGEGEGSERSGEEAELEAKAAEFEGWTDMQKAFRMGQKLGLAALGHSAGATDAAEGIHKEAQILADQLELDTLPPFEELTGEQAADDAAALHYILDSTKPIEDQLGEKSSELRSIFLVGIRLQILMLVFIPGDLQDPESLTMSVMMGVTAAGKKAGLSEDFMIERLRKIGNSPSHDAMKSELQRFLDDVFVKLEK